MASSSSTRLVTFREGFVADWELVRRLIDIEDRGATLDIQQDGRLRIIPPSVLSDDDKCYLRAHREDARRVVAYAAELATRPV